MQGRSVILDALCEDDLKKFYNVEVQIADFMKQLYEHFFLEKNEIKKLQKNISSELLASFRRHLTESEDINKELHNAVLN